MRLLHLRLGLVFTLLFMLFTFSQFSSHAQNSVEDECARFVLEVQAQIESLCPMGEGACYVHAPVEFEAVADSDAALNAAGERVPIESIQSLHTGELNLEAEEWGVAVIDFPLNDDVEANPRFLMLGDVTLTRVEDGNTENDFSVRTSAQEPSCSGAPNKLMLQTPQGVTVDFGLNGAEISVSENTLVVVSAIPYEEMTIIVASGEITITSEGVAQIVVAGEQVVIALGGDTGLVVVAVPGDPSEFDFALIQFLPFQTLSEVVELPSADRWTATGVVLEAGQSYLLVNSGLVKTIDYMPWSAPEGHSTADCSAAGRGDWDCKCRTLPEWGTCTLDEVASMTLLGRIGEGGEAFIVGSGGFFTADAAGELFLGANDNTFTDNVGSYYAIIATFESDGD